MIEGYVIGLVQERITWFPCVAAACPAGVLFCQITSALRVHPKIYGFGQVSLFEVFAGKEAQNLYGDCLECVSRSVSLFCVENSGTDIMTEDVGMINLGVARNLWWLKRKIMRNSDTQMDWDMVFGR